MINTHVQFGLPVLNREALVRLSVRLNMYLVCINKRWKYKKNSKDGKDVFLLKIFLNVNAAWQRPVIMHFTDFTLHSSSITLVHFEEVWHPT